MVSQSSQLNSNFHFCLKNKDCSNENLGNNLNYLGHFFQFSFISLDSSSGVQTYWSYWLSITILQSNIKLLFINLSENQNKSWSIHSKLIKVCPKLVTSDNQNCHNPSPKSKVQSPKLIELGVTLFCCAPIPKNQKFSFKILFWIVIKSSLTPVFE